MDQQTALRQAKTTRRKLLRFCMCVGPLALFTSAITLAAEIPPRYINSVVALGSIAPVLTPGEPSPHPKWVTEGTGFFYGSLAKDDPDPAKKRYEVYLVTARHVVEGHVANPFSELSVRLNPKESSKEVQEFPVPYHPDSVPGNGPATWFFHPNKNIDVAIVNVNLQFLHDQGFEPDWFVNDQTAANIGKLKELEVSAGDSVFVLGFPMNLAGEQKNLCDRSPRCNCPDN
jgi:hypothetical protein